MDANKIKRFLLEINNKLTCSFSSNWQIRSYRGRKTYYDFPQMYSADIAI